MKAVITERYGKPEVLHIIRVREMLGSGKLRTIIDRVYSLEQIQEAHSYVDTERKKGNVIVTLTKPKTKENDSKTLSKIHRNILDFDGSCGRFFNRICLHNI